MLEEPSDDRSYSNRLRSAGHAWPETAEPADDQVDRQALSRGGGQRLTDLPVFQLVPLRHQPRRAARLVVLDLSLDQLDEPAAHVPGRDEQPPELGRARPAGQVMEELIPGAIVASGSKKERG